MGNKIAGNGVQLGDSVTATQNFTLTAVAADGTMKLARGNAGATTQDVMTVDTSGRAAFPQGMGAVPATQSMVVVAIANGFGSTNTAVRRWTNIVTNQGSDITYADSATLGGQFTINTAGVYAISVADQYSAANLATGITLNQTSVTAVSANQLVIVSSTAANLVYQCGVTMYFPAGSVIRAVGNGISGTNTVYAYFSATRVA